MHSQAQKLMTAFFKQQRVQVMNMPLYDDELHNSYLYAWSAGVYPWYSDKSSSPKPHEDYADMFDITKEMVKKIIFYLEDRATEKKLVSFFELEHKFMHSYERDVLIKICRYIYLSNRFNNTLWRSLLATSLHPAQAKVITKKFDKSEFVES